MEGVWRGCVEGVMHSEQDMEGKGRPHHQNGFIVQSVSF